LLSALFSCLAAALALRSLILETLAAAFSDTEPLGVFDVDEVEVEGLEICSFCSGCLLSTDFTSLLASDAVGVVFLVVDPLPYAVLIWF